MYVPNYKLFCKTARPCPINLLLSLSFCPLSSKFLENSGRMPEITIFFPFGINFSLRNGKFGDTKSGKYAG